MSPKIINDIAPVINEPLTYIYSLSFQVGMFCWTLKNLNCSYIKEGDKSFMTNHMSPDFSQFFHKILEKLVSSRLNSFFKLTVRRMIYNLDSDPIIPRFWH